MKRCPACRRPMKRSTDANRRYWLLLHMIAEKLTVQGERYSADQWHLYAKSRWIGCDDFRLPNGNVLTIPRSSADLSSAEFNDYMTAIEAWASDRGVYLEDIAA